MAFLALALQSIDENNMIRKISLIFWGIIATLTDDDTCTAILFGGFALAAIGLIIKAFTFLKDGEALTLYLVDVLHVREYMEKNDWIGLKNIILELGLVESSLIIGFTGYIVFTAINLIANSRVSKLENNNES